MPSKSAAATLRGGTVDAHAAKIARAFFQASTKLSENEEDILPQEVKYQTLNPRPLAASPKLGNVVVLVSLTF